MISGRQALASIDQALNEAHDKIDKVEDQIAEVTAAGRTAEGRSGGLPGPGEGAR